MTEDFSTAAALTQAEIAKLLKVSTKTVQRLAKKGRIPGALSLGVRAVRFDRSKVELWIASGCKEQAS